MTSNDRPAQLAHDAVLRCLLSRRQFAAEWAHSKYMFFDVFNLLNANPALNVNRSSDSPGPFGSPLAIVPPRIARVGMKVAW